jgi:hypothetical protein
MSESMDVDVGLRALLDRGFRFQTVRDDDGEVAVLVGSRGWTGCYDRVHIWGEDQAIAARVVPHQRSGADEVVWSYEDGAVPTIQALLELPDPDASDAPQLTKRPPAGLWLPSCTAGV